MPSLKIVIAATCPTCCRAAGAPFRVLDAQGSVVHGCVDEFHTDHLASISASQRWHNRPEARKLRAALKAQRDGWITRAA